MAFSDFSLGQLQQQREGINRASTANYFNAVQMGEQMKARDEQAAQQYFANQQAMKDRAERQRQNAFNIALQEKKDRLAIAQHEKDQAAQFRMKQMEMDSYAARNKSAEDIQALKLKDAKDYFAEQKAAEEKTVANMAPQLAVAVKQLDNEIDALNQVIENGSSIKMSLGKNVVPGKWQANEIAKAELAAKRLPLLVRQRDGLYNFAMQKNLSIGEGGAMDLESGNYFSIPTAPKAATNAPTVKPFVLQPPQVPATTNAPRLALPTTRTNLPTVRQASNGWTYTLTP